MITKAEYLEAKALIKLYEKQQTKSIESKYVHIRLKPNTNNKTTWYYMNITKYKRIELGDTIKVKESSNKFFRNHWQYNDSLFISKEDAELITQNTI